MGWQGTVAPHLPSREGRWPSKGTAQMKQHCFYLLNSPSHFSTHYFCPIVTPSLPSNASGATRKLQDFWVCCQVWAVPPKRTVLPLDLSLAPMSLSHKSPLSPSAAPLGMQNAPDQGSNLCPLQWECSLNHWTVREVPCHTSFWAAVINAGIGWHSSNTASRKKRKKGISSLVSKKAVLSVAD